MSKNMKHIFRIGTWAAPSLTHIESRKHIKGEYVDSAVVLIRAGSVLENNTFNNCVFICQHQEIAESFRASGVDDYRIVVGGIAEALEYLGFAQKPGSPAI